jgi:hypothetical protein
LPARDWQAKKEMIGRLAQPGLSATSQQHFSLITNQHQPSATSQTNNQLGPAVRQYYLHDLLVVG